MPKKVAAALVAAGCAGILAGGEFIAPAASAATVPAQSGSPSGLVFLQTNDQAGNDVAVYDRNDNGTLTAAGTYSTGGLGGQLDGPAYDQLASQGSVTYDRARQLLYVVNAGSNSVTVFAVQGDTLHRTQVVDSGGVFPVSVAVQGGVAYVLNARDGGSVQGFLRAGDRLIQVPEWHRELSLDTSTAPAFLGTPGDVAFSPGGDKLAVTTKRNGLLDVFTLDRLGAPSSTPVVTPDSGTLPFSLTFDAAGRLYAAEAAGSVASYAVNPGGSLSLIDRQSTNQKATCWVVNTGGHVFVSNTGSDTLGAFSAQPQGLAGLGLTATDAAPTDLGASSDGRYLYVRTGGVGRVEEFAIGSDGALARIGSVPTPGGVAGDGLAAS